MGRWRDVIFRVPNIAVLSDQELRDLLPYRDGRWSEAIARATRKLKAARLDLNSQWADTPQDWSCPCCMRPKYATLRVSEKSVLLAVLHEHHDHLQDYMGRRLQGELGAPWSQFIPPGTYHLEHLGSRLLARFQPALVCADCNGAEASAKNKLRHIHRDFSFRLSEIAAFISITPNADHQVDFAKADALWTAAEADFQGRLRLAETLIENILGSRMTQEIAPGRDRITSEFDAHVRYWFSRSHEGSGVLNDLDALRLRSIAREGVGLQVEEGTARQRRPSQPPTDADVENHDGGGMPKLWALLSSSSVSRL